MIEPELIGFDLETAIGMTAAAKLVRGRRGRRAHRETLRRWAIRGCVVGGERIFLRSVVVSGERLTTELWLKEFNKRRTALGFQQEAKPRSTRQQKNDVERAKHEVGRKK